MGKARSFRLTKENEVRLEELIKRMDLDNANKVFNKIIEDYHFYEKYKKVLFHLRSLMAELKQEVDKL